MNNAEKFKKHFGIYATELWCMEAKDFLKWLNSEAADEWIPAHILPKEDGDYLVKYNLQSKYDIKHLYDVMSFANDLYKVDNEDFIAEKGESGWYYLHPTFGYCQEKGIAAWKPII